MTDITMKDLFIEIITGISKRINMKALEEILWDNYEDYNEALAAYYRRAHYEKEHPNMFRELTHIDTKDQDDHDYLKGFESGKIYKTRYDYRRGHLQPIKQKDTGLIEEWNNGFIGGFSWRFDVYEYLAVNNLHVRGVWIILD